MKFDWIVNKLKERIYPYTHADAVIMDDEGTKLPTTINEINERINNIGGGGEGGTTNYTLLENLPQVNDVTLTGNKSLSDLGITATAIGVAEGANNYVHPSYTAKIAGLYKVTVNNTGHVSSASSVTKEDITDLGIPASDTTYSVATQSADGLMSSQDKTKISNVPTIIFSTTVPETLADNTICYVYED